MPAVAVVVFQFRFQWLLLSKNHRGACAGADSVQKHAAVLGSVPTSRCLCCPAPKAAQPTLVLGNEELNWQIRGCAFAIQFSTYLGTSWDHHRAQPGALPTDFSADAGWLGKVSIPPSPLPHPLSSQS